MSDSDSEHSGSEGEAAEVVENISHPAVIQKYRTAAAIVDGALGLASTLCRDGARVFEICQATDEYMLEETSKLFPRKKKLSKGIAFPTCISVNNCVSHFSPSAEDDTILQNGDMVKIDLGVQVDEFPALAAKTVVVGSESEPITGRKADVLACTLAAAQAAMRLVRVGNQSSDLYPVLDAIAESYQCHAVEGVLSHEMSKGVLDGERVILLKPTQNQHSKEFTFEANSVFHIDLVFSTGEGKPKDLDVKPTVFKKTDQVYSLRMKASRTLFSEVNKRFGSFGFALRNAETKNARLGITEIVNHNLLQPYPVLFEKQGEFVAQVKFTVLLQPTGPLRVTNFEPPAVHSECKIQDPDVIALLQSAVRSGGKKKKSKSKKKKAAAASTGGGASSSQ